MAKYTREKKKYSIIIPSWFTPNQHGKYGRHETFWFALHCLVQMEKTLKEDEIDYELIIIDNGSSLDDDFFTGIGDGKSIFTNESFFSPVRTYWDKADILIKNKTNFGFAPSINEGVNVANGDYIVCVNNDILVWNGWIKGLTDMLNEKELTPTPGVAMPALMKQTKDAREALQLETKDIDMTQNFDKYGCGAEFGSLFMLEKELVDEYKSKYGNLMDESFILGMGEDRLLWHQIRTLGYDTYRTHKVRVFHQGNLTIGKVKDRKDYTEKNRELLEIKKNN
jgi:GT2 family glycosyltransferase